MDYCLWVVCWVRRKGTQWPTPPWSLGHRELVTCRTGSDFLWYQTLTKPNTDTQWEEGSHCSHTHAKTWLGEFSSCLVLFYFLGWGRGSVWSQILTSNYALEKSLNKNSLPPVFFCSFVCLFFWCYLQKYHENTVDHSFGFFLFFWRIIISTFYQ